MEGWEGDGGDGWSNSAVVFATTVTAAVETDEAMDDASAALDEKELALTTHLGSAYGSRQRCGGDFPR